MGLSPNGGVGSPLQLPDDYFAVPSSSEDEDPERPTRGGWKLVETKVRNISFYRVALSRLTSVSLPLAAGAAKTLTDCTYELIRYRPRRWDEHWGFGEAKRNRSFAEEYKCWIVDGNQQTAAQTSRS
jgi:hypothetical protein